MPLTADLRLASEQLLTTGELRRDGVSEREGRRQLSAGTLIRLRPGMYIRGEFWTRSTPELRHLAAILTAHRAAPTRPVFSHLSAAAIHGLPAWSPWLHRLTVGAQPPSPLAAHTLTVAGRPAASSQTLIRHRTSLEEGEVESRAQLRCTGPRRTVADLARTESFEVALSAADAHLRATASVGRHVDRAELWAWRDDMSERAARLHTRGGSRALRALAALADPLADSPLESVSRLRFHQLGIDVSLQVAVAAPSRGSLYLDFVLDGLGFWGEADGRSKYLDAELLNRRSTAEVLVEEKRRAEWIAGTTGLRVIRWGAGEVASLSRFAAHLRAHGVPIPGSPSVKWGHSVRDFLRDIG